MRTGLSSADNINADIVIKYDADLQHEPTDILNLIKPIDDNQATLYMEIDLKMNYKMPFIRKIGNKFFTKLMKWLTGWPLMDSQPGIFAVNNVFLQIFICQVITIIHNKYYLMRTTGIYVSIMFLS